MDEPPIFGLDDVGKILGVTGRTVSKYLSSSQNGGRYADHQFPKPDGRMGKSPYWLKSRFDEIWDWHRARRGQGVGGGRPSHHGKSEPEQLNVWQS